MLGPTRGSPSPGQRTGRRLVWGRAFASAALVLLTAAGLAACDGDPDEPVGRCETFDTIIEISTAEGSAPIASVEVSMPCMRSYGCWPGPGADGGAAQLCSQMKVAVRRPGRCELAFGSTEGARVTASVEVERVVTDRSCVDGVGQVHPNVPFLRPVPSSLTVNLGPAQPDAGRD